MAPKPRLLEQVRERLRLKHYSIRTEQAYLDWIKRYILFHGKRHPVSMGKEEVEVFLTHLAVERKVAASTQNQALSAILFLYGRELEWLDNVQRVKRPVRVPVVLTEACENDHDLHPCAEPRREGRAQPTRHIARYVRLRPP